MRKKDFTNLFDLTGKVAVITGGMGGIGRDLVLGLGQYGSDVVVLDKKINETEFLEDEFKKLGRKISFVQLDITDSSKVSEVFSRIKKEQGKIDILINAAGINKRVPTVDYEEEDWDKIIDINLKGKFLCSREAARIMKNQQQGKIINFGSVSSVLGHPNHSAYAASKGGVLLLTKVMAMELALDNINVNAIGPAYIETDLTREYLSQGDNYQKIVDTIPMGRLGRTEDIVGVVIYLASAASDFVTGTLILVDGGRTAD